MPSVRWHDSHRVTQRWRDTRRSALRSLPHRTKHNATLRGTLTIFYTLRSRRPFSRPSLTPPGCPGRDLARRSRRLGVGALTGSRLLRRQVDEGALDVVGNLQKHAGWISCTDYLQRPYVRYELLKTRSKTLRTT